MSHSSNSGRVIGNLSEYITLVAWSPNGLLAASSAAGEVVLWQNSDLVSLLTVGIEFIDCVAFSADGKFLAAGGQDGKVRIWSTIPILKKGKKQEREVKLIATLDNKYIASGNFDNTIAVLEYGSPELGLMGGFPGKISNLTWSQPLSNNSPLLAASTLEYVAVWEKEANDEDDWNAGILTFHDSKIPALEFHPHSLLLASAADDGWLCLWAKAKKVRQILEGAKGGFSCLAWSQDGQKLAAGGQDGELIIWSKSM